ncbi:MAG: peptidylprolyl isomerase [Pirellulales bacterium]|nr:peptidylprolyl isomerase [Pirellulales bacterium]
MASRDGSPEVVTSGQIKRRLKVAVGALAVVAVCLVFRSIGGRERVGAQVPGDRNEAVATDNAPVPRQGGNQAPAQSGGTSSQQKIVAIVNAEEIHREQLAQEALAQFGKDVLEGLKTKYLISSYAKRVGVTVTSQEVDEEITRMSRKFAIPPDQWLKMIQDERGIKPERYAEDIIRPTLILRKLAANRIQPTENEIEEAYQTQFGPAVKARIIVLENLDEAKQVLAEAKQNPDGFGKLAKDKSRDPNSASLQGLIPPIRHGLGDPALEKVAFQLKEGEISPIVDVASQFVILKCEGRAQTRGAPPREQVRGRLEEFVRDKKLRTSAGELFQRLEKETEVLTIYKDPQMASKMPGIAASIGGQTITMRELAEACISRHGEEVLDVMINRRLLDQELKQRRISVHQQQLDAEIAHSALRAGKLTKNGKPDTDGWLKIVVGQQGIPLEKYIRDSVWPSAALKLLVADKVKVTEEDIERGYKANYGAKAQVRAIVLDSQRRAQDVWQQARDNPTVEFFGQLAEQFSMEPASKANSGRVPPIQQCGGQPELEKEAFALQPGEISAIVQVQDKFVILYLEKFSDPVKIKREEVQSLIAEDVYEKKLRYEMTKEFDRIKDQANIDNFLAGTTHSPERKMLGKRDGPNRGGSPQQLPASTPSVAGGQGPAAGGNIRAGYEAAAQPQRGPAAADPRAGTVRQR